MQHPHQARPPWMKWLPHVNDSVLFILGIILMVTIQQFPGSNSWLTAKLSALVIYILLGMVVMKWAKSQRTRFVAWLSALLVFAYMVGVAISKQPLVFV